MSASHWDGSRRVTTARQLRRQPQRCTCIHRDRRCIDEQRNAAGGTQAHKTCGLGKLLLTRVPAPSWLCAVRLVVSTAASDAIRHLCCMPCRQTLACPADAWHAAYTGQSRACRQVAGRARHHNAMVLKTARHHRHGCGANRGPPHSCQPPATCHQRSYQLADQRANQPFSQQAHNHQAPNALSGACSRLKVGDNGSKLETTNVSKSSQPNRHTTGKPCYKQAAVPNAGTHAGAVGCNASPKLAGCALQCNVGLGTGFRLWDKARQGTKPHTAALGSCQTLCSPCSPTPVPVAQSACGQLQRRWGQ